VQEASDQNILERNRQRAEAPLQSLRPSDPQGGQKRTDEQILTPYAPQGNLLEILWRFMQYDWFPCAAYAAFQHLCTAVEAILQQFGTKYTIDFQAA
jgi:hypothetical protein